MKFFLDCEFMEDGRTVDLLSIGVVSEDGREWYRQNAGADLHKANAWVKENVLPKLLPCPKGLMQVAHRGSKCGHPECSWRPTHLIGRELEAFVAYGVGEDRPPVSRPQKPEFWGYYADYDWVAVCQLFGKMIDLPSGWPMYCRDIKQWCDELGNPELSKQTDEHNALADARWNREAYEFLVFVKAETVFKGVYAYAGTRDKQEVPARQVGEEPKHVRGPKAKRVRQVVSSGDQ